MAGVAATLLTGENLVSPCPATVVKKRWKVDFSRFFSYPPFISSSSPSLKSLPKFKTRRGGTWISSSSSASLQLTSPSAILTVLIRGTIYEEHFVFNLHFSWPQVSCVTNCPTRGSRVVFASFSDNNSQIHKFALRFPTSGDAHAFLDAAKESTREVFVGFPRNDFGCENSLDSKYTASNALQYRTDEDLSFTNPNVSFHSERPVSSIVSRQHACSQQPQLVNETIFSALPTSFTQLLTTCLTDDQSEPPSMPGETDLMSQVMRYIPASSFHDLLARVEAVINELGGDLAISS